jgi:hypothetical protein
MKTKEISSLYRSFSPRMTLYNTDGNGRDTYINYNNGGFWVQGVKRPMGQKVKQVSEKYKIKYGGKNVAPFKYYSDGSGRDSYVIWESGGLKHDFHSLNEFHLKDVLRSPKDCIFEFNENKARDGSRKKIVYVSKQELEVNDYLKQNQRGIIKRLYNDEKHKFM